MFRKINRMKEFDKILKTSEEISQKMHLKGMIEKEKLERSKAE